MRTVFLLRHGALPSDCQKRFIGQTDVPLAPEGARQAEALGRALQARGIDTVYCSDLLRARQTADIVVGKLNIPVNARRDLREIDMGQWDGLSRQEVATRFPAQYAARGENLEHYRIPDGESFADCRRRILDAWQDIVDHGGQRIVIVGHAGANRVLLCYFLKKSLAEMFSVGQEYACVNIIEQDGEICRVRLINGQPADLTALSSES